MAAIQSHTELREAQFSCKHHATNLLKSLNETRKNPDLCDAYVVIDDHKIFVQKNVLSAASQYLRALFLYDGKLSQHDGKTCIKLCMSLETLHTILDYIYTCTITLTEENIEDVLRAADLLLLTDLKDTCCKFLEECLSPNNCIGIRDLTAQLSCQWIHLKVTQYLDQHVREATYSEEFLRMPAEDVCQLLSRDTLQVRHEDDILEALIRWARKDPENHRTLLPDMIRRCVRVSWLTPDLMSQQCGGVLGDGDWGVQVMAVVEERRREAGEEDPRGCQTVIVVCGGEDQVSKSTEVTVMDVTRFIPLKRSRESTDGWLNMASMLTPRYGHGLVEIGGFLYTAGGRDHQCRILNSVERYDPVTNTWTYLAPMEHSRISFGMVAVDDQIYAMGGGNDMTDPLVSMEVYNIFTDKWRPLPDMILKRGCAAFAAADKKIYVMAGGIVGKSYEAVECFDTRTETWSSVSPMRERRCDARAVAVDNDIYVFGGYRRLECPSAMQSGHSFKFCGMEMYTSKSDSWMSLPCRFGSLGLCTMSEQCCLYGALYDGEDVLVVGVLDVGQGQVHCVRAFNRHTNIWHTVVQDHPHRQEGYQCCLLRMPTSALWRLQQLPNRPSSSPRLSVVGWHTSA